MKVIAAIPVLATIVMVSGAVAEAGEPMLRGGLASLDPWRGTWQIEDQWSDGSRLWAQAEYRALLGGAFLEGRVFVRDNGGELYQRYRSVFKWDSEAGVDAYTFSHDGSYAVSALVVDGPVSTTEWSAGTTRISERLEMESDETMRWQVWATSEDGERSLIMDGRWKRVQAEAIEVPRAGALAKGLNELRVLLGGWETASAWKDGAPSWSRSEYRMGVAGRFVDANTWTVDKEGNDSQRNETVFTGATSDGEGRVVSFDHEGGVSEAQWTAIEAPGTRGLEIHKSSTDGAELLQEIRFESRTAFRWRVAKRETAESPWAELIDAVWRRQGPDAGLGREPIDPGRFVTSGVGLRSFTKTAIIDAPVHEVYAAWADSDAWASLWGPPSAARIDLAIGGRYEWMFNGWLGGNGCQVLSYIPDRMISFSWNAPPAQPETRLARTWVVVETEAAADGRTHVRLTHLGFGEGPEWDETYAYFDNAWERVLALMAGSLGGDDD